MERYEKDQQTPEGLPGTTVSLHFSFLSMPRATKEAQTPQGLLHIQQCIHLGVCESL